MLTNNAMQASKSSSESPVNPVIKTSAVAILLGLQKAEDVTSKDAYLPPRNHDTLNRLRPQKFFYSMGLKTGYWELEFEEGDDKRRP